MDDKGLFYCSSGSSSGSVKVFGIEHYYHDYCEAIFGALYSEGNIKIKMTYGQDDGTTIEGYSSSDASIYISLGQMSTGTGYINKMTFTKYGFMYPKGFSGSASTYYCDQFSNSSASNTIVMFGVYASGTQSGINAISTRNNSIQYASSHLSCKPLLSAFEEV